MTIIHFFSPHLIITLLSWNLSSFERPWLPKEWTLLFDINNHHMTEIIFWWWPISFFLSGLFCLFYWPCIKQPAYLFARVLQFGRFREDKSEYMNEKHGLKISPVHLLRLETSIFNSLFESFDCHCAPCQLLCYRFCVSVVLAWCSQHEDCTEITLLAVL